VIQGQLECDSDTVFDLAAYVLQAVHGDYVEYVIFVSISHLTLPSSLITWCHDSSEVRSLI